MPITPTNTVDPSTMASNWGPGVRNNSQKWLNKYLKPKRAFNATPDQSQATWAAKLQEAISANSYAAGMANADLNQAAQNATQFGQANYAAAGTNKAAKYAKKAPALASAINSVLSTLPARGTAADNDNRMLSFARGMRQFKGKIQ